MIPSEQQGGREGKVCTCVMCAFYVGYPGADDRGVCRINAPIARDEGLGIWPRVLADDWCGEWQSIDLAPEGNGPQ